MQVTQQDVRKARFSRMRDEIAALAQAFAGLKGRADAAVKDAAKRHDAWLLEHTRKEHLG